MSGDVPPAQQLAATSIGGGAGRRLVLVHGFTQTGRSWQRFAEPLAAQREVLLVDAPGHGDSDGIRVDLTRGASLLGLAGGPAVYAGYSMGARLCLHLALARPDLVQHLVLISATAGIEDAAERAARRAADEELANTIERDGVAPFLDSWLAQPMFAGLHRVADGAGSGDAAGATGGVYDLETDRADRLRNTAAGLAASLRLAGTGCQEPLWDCLHRLTMPVTVVAGANDAKFVSLGQRLAETVGATARFLVVPDAGHAVHLERPDEVLPLLAATT